MTISGEAVILLFFIILIILLIPFILFYKYDYIKKSKYVSSMFRKIKKINRKEEFEKVYDNIINYEGLDKIKKYYIWTILRIVVCFMVFGSIGILFLSGFSNNSGENSLVAVILFILFIIVFFELFCFLKPPKKYKEQIIQIFMKFINPNFKYTSNIDTSNLNFIQEHFYNNTYNEILKSSKSELDACNLITKLYLDSGFRDNWSNTTSITDYLEYKNNLGSNVKMADLWLYYSEKGRIRKDEYKGIIARISRDECIDNEILIERNKVLKQENRVKSELKEFEMYFDIYAKEQNCVEFILSDSIKKQILSLYKEYGIMFEISIKGKDVFVRFFTGSMFESVAFFGTRYGKRKLYRDYIIFKSILEIVDKIDEIL